MRTDNTIRWRPCSSSSSLRFRVSVGVPVCWPSPPPSFRYNAKRRHWRRTKLGF
jgi:hypothetical protein